MPDKSHFGDKADGVKDRRRAKRERIVASVSLWSVDPPRAVLLTDISTTGCRLRGQLLPGIGRDVWLKAGDVHLYGRVVWSSDEETGIEFDQPAEEEELQKLRDFRMHQLSNGEKAEGPPAA